MPSGDASKGGRVQCTSLGRRPQNRAIKKGYRPKNRRSQKRKGKAVFCRSRARAPVGRCRGGLAWSVSPCCACWSLWLAGSGALSLLVSLPAFRGSFLVTCVAALRYKGADTRTVKFWTGIPYPALRPHARWTAIFVILYLRLSTILQLVCSLPFCYALVRP